MFKDESEDVKKHVWWGLCPDGLAYQAIPTLINCPPNCTSLQYVPPKWKYQSDFITPVAKKFIMLAEGTAIFPPIGAENPPIGLYILILSAVEHVFKSFFTGTFKTPTQFSNKNIWCSVNHFHTSLLSINAKC
ncbi:hypothetical protein V8E53_012404 [Lactarius tabidus]